MVKSVPETLYDFFLKHTTTTLNLNNSTEAYYNLMKYLTEAGLLQEFIKGA